ncbi:hypothetical protein EV426DRAFT_275687 [Tirmania nivea]|nr:hypothetical protein EV426DRAFT_275687 [Tirmania nivea]
MLPRSEYGDTGDDLEDNSKAPLLRNSSSLDPKDPTDCRARAGEDAGRVFNFLACPQSRHSLQSESGATEGLLDGNIARAGVVPEELLPWWSRERFTGSVLFNVFTFLLPAIYMTMAKLWVSQLDSKMVVATDIYAYIHTIVEILNEGLPKVSYLIIADKSTRSIATRIQLSNTLIAFQATCGLVLALSFFIFAQSFADTFIPAPVRGASLTYIRIASFSALMYATEVAVTSATRCLDRPDIPLMVNTVKICGNILLDILILSNWRIGKGWFTPDVNTQARVRFFCELCAGTCGLTLYIVKSRRLIATERSRQAMAVHSPERLDESGDIGPNGKKATLKPTWASLLTLARPGVFTMLESGFRYAIYLWLVTGVVKTGLTYATAWGVFNTIRWGVVMVPVYALEASSGTFVGHRWGAWRSRVGAGIGRKVKASTKDLKYITRPAIVSALFVLAIEIPLCLLMSMYFIRPYAYFISHSDAVSDLVTHFWRTIDWCYIIYGIATQLSTILLATKPHMYWCKSFMTVALWDLPWALAVSRVALDKETGWRWHGWIFGGGAVWMGVVTGMWVVGWWWALRRGLLKV